MSVQFDPANLRVVLGFLATKKATRGFTAKGRLDGLALQATDLDWSSGSGADVRGPAEAMMMSMLGRTDALADLEGEGVARLRSRL
jgi:hypothetical protein